MTKKNLQQLKAIVCEILKTDEQTRNSDSLLYLRVLERIAKDTDGGNMPFSMTVAYFLTHMQEHGFPPFESVRRARQKLQAEYPELKACEKVEAMRKENEKEFREFALHHKNCKQTYSVRCLDTGEIFPSAADAAKAFGISVATIRSACEGKHKTRIGKRFEYYSKFQQATTFCWNCANAYGGCSWTGRDENGAVMFQPVEGWTAIPTTVNIGGYRSERSYHVIECPEYVPEKSGASG